jgi:hypothetical protein
MFNLKFISLIIIVVSFFPQFLFAQSQVKNNQNYRLEITERAVLGAKFELLNTTNFTCTYSVTTSNGPILKYKVLSGNRIVRAGRPRSIQSSCSDTKMESVKDHNAGVAHLGNKDLDAAVISFESARRKGHKHSSSALCQIYNEQANSINSHKKAISMCNESKLLPDQDAKDIAASRIHHSQRGIAIIYSNEVNDAVQAFVWNQRAAENGNEYAQAALGDAYSNGQGVAQDFNLALRWYKKAERNGFPNVKEAISVIETILAQRSAEKIAKERAEKEKKIKSEWKQKDEKEATRENIQPIIVAVPTYPSRAYKRGLGGHCTLTFTVTKAGTVDMETVFAVDEEPPRLKFCSSSKKAALQLKYNPSIINGVPVAVQNVEYTYVFSLD